MTDDIELLRRYAEDSSEAAFSELVERHIDFVYTSALRRAHGSHRAEDVAQIVFSDLARKAHKLLGRKELVGWLYVSTYYAATSIVRREARREIREQSAQLNMAAHSDQTATTDWQAIRPVLDQALHSLNEADRTALLLRFFKSQSFAEIGTVLCLTEEAARKRVDRALERLRPLLARHGVTSTAAAIAVALGCQTVAAAPIGLATTVASEALAAHLAGGGLAAGNLLNIMTTSKSVTSAAAVAALLATGSAIYEANDAANASRELAKAKTERAVFQQELNSATKRIRILEGNPDQLANAQGSNGNGRVTVGFSNRGRNSAPLAPEIEKVLEHPELRALYLQKVALRAKADFGNFFLSAGLTPVQQETFAKLITARESANIDLLASLKSQNALSPDGMTADGALNTQELITQEAAKIASDFNQGMNELLGADLDAQLGHYAATMSDRNAVTQLANQLASSNSPLTPQQADQLTQIVAQQGLDASSINSSPNGRNPAIIAALSGTLAGIPINQSDAMVIADSMEQSGAGALVTDAAISKAQEILNPQQLAALQAYQMQQVIQIKLAPAPTRG